MTPERLNEWVTLYEADCRDVLPTLTAVDAVVTDPPYGVGYVNKRADIRSREYAGRLLGDGDGAAGQAALDACFARGWPVCAFADHRHPWAGAWRQWLVWDKGEAVGGGGDIATCWKFTWELVQVGGFGRLNGRRDGSVLRFPVSQAHYHDHPTQKPAALMRYLVRKLTRPGDTILDPFAGSGTTAIAAMKEGRRCVLVEQDPSYCDVIRRRVRDADGRGAGSLFAGTPDLFAAV